MRTVKEVSKLTGISVRTLHYYDEIGLLKPTGWSEKRYRLYDDKALEILQQILFFREFEIPLKEIKTIMDNPVLERNQILQSQKKMLGLKKERLARLISSINDILKGDNKMDFEVFSKDEIETLYQTTVANMTEDMKKAAIEQYGGLDGFHNHYIEGAASEHAQKNYQKLVEWYGDKERVLKTVENPLNSQITELFQSRIDVIMKKLAAKRGKDVASFEVKEVIGEYGFVSKQLYQMPDEKPLMLELAALYKSDVKVSAAIDDQYGAGTAEFFIRAVEEFYKS